MKLSDKLVKAPKKKSKPVSKVYKHLPRGYKYVDPARDAKQNKNQR